MQCRFHPDRKAEYYCETCHIPLCRDCGEEVRPGAYTCFQCGMIQSLSQAGTSLAERQKRAVAKRSVKRWGPFHYFLVVSCFLIGVMWSVVIFGGTPAPHQTASFELEKGQAGRVLLFLVDGAIKRYAHHEKKGYPHHLSDLVPKYLQIREEQIPSLNQFTYQREGADKGYRLSLAQTRKGEMRLIFTPHGIEYSPPTEDRT
jgi:hypothetical protein